MALIKQCVKEINKCSYNSGNSLDYDFKILYWCRNLAEWIFCFAQAENNNRKDKIRIPLSLKLIVNTMKIWLLFYKNEEYKQKE